MLFCAFGCPLCPLCFLPLALAPSPLAFTVAFGSHSPCIPLAFGSHYPLAYPLHSARIPCTILGGSGRVGGSGRWVGSALGGGSGRWVGSPSALPLCPCPETCPPPPLLPPSPRGGLICFAPAALASCWRFSVLRPPQSVGSNQIVNVPPLIGLGA